jgi:hypothetical protein
VETQFEFNHARAPFDRLRTCFETDSPLGNPPQERGLEETAFLRSFAKRSVSKGAVSGRVSEPVANTALFQTASPPVVLSA